MAWTVLQSGIHSISLHVAACRRLLHFLFSDYRDDSTNDFFEPHST